MSTSWPERAEGEMLRAEIEILRRRRDSAHAELTDVVERLRREAADAEAAAHAAEEAAARLASGAERALALQERIDRLRQETSRARESAEAARRDLAREAAAGRGLLARLVTIAGALGDAELRRWARRAMTAPEAP